MDNQSVLVSIMHGEDQKANSKKIFTRRIKLIMMLLFGVDFAAIILYVFTTFSNSSDDVKDLVNVFAKDIYIAIHILM